MNDTVERGLITGYACITDAVSGAQRNQIQELNPIDREVVLGELDAAGVDLLIALAQLPDWASRTEEQFFWHLEKLGRRYRPRLPFPDCLDCLVLNAHDNLVRAAQTAEGPKDLIEDINHALCRLDRVVLVREPQRFRARLEGCDDPTERVRIAAFTEHVELMLEESRALVRQRGAR